MLDTGLTPPKMGMPHAAFAERLLVGLQGAAGFEADAFGVTELHDGRGLLRWSAERQGKLGTTSLLKQEVNLAPERPARPGAGLMELLFQQAQQSSALQCVCRNALPPRPHLLTPCLRALPPRPPSSPRRPVVLPPHPHAPSPPRLPPRFLAPSAPRLSPRPLAPHPLPPARAAARQLVRRAWRRRASSSARW